MLSTSHSKKPLHREVLKNKILLKSDDLLPMPQVVLKAQKLMLDSNLDLKELGTILETDQLITVRALKAANSAYYGLKSKVSSIQQASIILGCKVLGEIVTIAGTATLLSKTLKEYGLNSGDLWRHSLAAAYGSRIIANKKKSKLTNEAFLAGLFHDVGKIIMNSHILEKKGEIESFMEEKEKTFLDAEKQILGFDHAEISSELCKKWNFSKELIGAIRYHHSPFFSKVGELSYILYVADLIAKMNENSIRHQIDKRAMEFLGLQKEDVSNIMSEVAESVNKITAEILRN